jgi:nitrogen fixation/metabolism regulation signal transduction histidine kinase
MNGSLLTCFASAERSPQDEILRQYRVLARNEDLIVVLNSVASMVTVLNENRQIVFVNKVILDMLGNIDIHQVLGKRVGELFGCRYAFEVNGCGTSQHCSACGAVRSMLDCVKETVSVEECSLTNDDAQSTIDLRVHSTYINVYTENLILCSIFDISSEKRRGVMEHIFFHDLMNTINGITGVTNLFGKGDTDEQQMYISYLTLLLHSLTEQIQSHRVLTMAENNKYRGEQQELSSLDFLVNDMAKYKQQAEVEEKEIRIAEHSENHSFVSDKTLLSRGLGNMFKNALEAEPAGAVIEVGVRKDDNGYICFWVHNDSVISEYNKLKVFSRSFSTKGSNRGLGTYSMKFLTEKYLKGVISFTSNQNEGTVFTVKIPI